MKRLVWSALPPDERRAALARPEGRAAAKLKDRVRAIVDEVRDGGWDALTAAAKRIDGSAPRLVPVAERTAEARASLSAGQLAAFDLAVRNIRRFHEASRPADVSVETMPGSPTIRRSCGSASRTTISFFG